MTRAAVLILPGILLGLLVGAQWQTHAERDPVSSRYSADLAAYATDIQGEQDLLREQLTALRAELDGIQEQTARMDARGAALKRDIDELEAAAGLDPASGPGVVITLDDGRLPATADRLSIELAIVHSQDITDVFNAAWKAGALGISVNGERVTAATACVGATIQINGRLMSPPFVISVLGPTDRLMALLGDPAELRDLKLRRELYGLGLDLSPAAEVQLPAYAGVIPVRHARPL